MICADTSFLFSLFGNDAHTPLAQDWVRKTGAPIAITVLNEYELGNAARFAAFRGAISKKDAQQLLDSFESDLASGHLQFERVDFPAVFIEAKRLSEAYTGAGGHRSLDILHVAAASQLKANTLLTFDLKQRQLANHLRIHSGF